MHDLSEPGVTKTIQAPDRVKFLHIDIPVGHAGWIDMKMDNFSDEERVLVGTEFDHVVHYLERVGVSARFCVVRVILVLVENQVCSGT